LAAKTALEIDLDCVECGVKL